MAITIRPTRISDVQESCKVRHHSFLGTPLSMWLAGHTESGTVLRMSSYIFSSVILGIGQEYVAVDDTGKIVGSISYSFKDSTKPARRSTSSILANLEAWLFSWEFYLLNIATFWREREVSKERARRAGLLVQRMDETAKRNLSDNGIEKWVYVKVLAVDPAAQGSGIGGKLLQLALDMASERNVPCYLESSKAGYPFYLRKGFVDLDSPCSVEEDGKQIWNSRTVLWTPKPTNLENETR